jgi:hypothetical protein
MEISSRTGLFFLTTDHKPEQNESSVSDPTLQVFSQQRRKICRHCSLSNLRPRFGGDGLSRFDRPSANADGLEYRHVSIRLHIGYVTTFVLGTIMGISRRQLYGDVADFRGSPVGKIGPNAEA